MARASRGDWLQAGAVLLAQEGEAALTIQRLAAALGRTKGSFYHHFAHREAFSQALLSDWEARTTATVMRRVDACDDPRHKLRLLGQLTSGSADGPLEQAVRAWALRDPLAASFQRRVDAARRAYTISLAEAVLADPAEARVLGTLLFTVFLGAQQSLPPIEGAAREKLYHELIGRFNLHPEAQP